MDVIDSFKGKNFFLSNFYSSPITYDGLTYGSNEAAFQAQKTLSLAERKKFTALNPSEAKRLGRSVQLRKDWEQVKDRIMLDLARIKFSDEALRDKLIRTGSATLIGGNDWNDRYWGVCNGVGKNQLGEILMQVRSEIRSKNQPNL